MPGTVGSGAPAIGTAQPPDGFPIGDAPDQVLVSLGAVELENGFEFFVVEVVGGSHDSI